MSLEATIIVLDNSGESLNGDFAPNRFEAQADAVHTIFNRKVMANPENEVGLMVMGGKGPEVLVTLTQDEGKIISALHTVKQGGEADLLTGIQVAQLALKHRQNKNQRQRVIVFSCSPVKDTQAALVKLGKKMKKNNVALDIISFGTPSIDLSIPSLSPSSSSAPAAPSTTETNSFKLSALIDAVSSSENSHLLEVEPGPALLSERVNQSPILRGEGEGGGSGGGGGGGAGGGEDEEFGVDPNLDPELAMALRMSFEEERARLAAAAASSSTSASAALEPVPEGVSTSISDPTGGASIPSGSALASGEADIKPFSNSAGEGAAPEVSMGDGAGEDEDEDLKRALALSEGAEGTGEGGEVEDVDVSMEEQLQHGAGGEGGEEDDEDMDEDMARAIALSMQEAEEEEGKK